MGKIIATRFVNPFTDIGGWTPFSEPTHRLQAGRQGK